MVNKIQKNEQFSNSKYFVHFFLNLYFLHKKVWYFTNIFIYLYILLK